MSTLKYTNCEGKPNAVIDYSKYMHGVDILNLKNSFFSMKRKYYKWYKYVFFHLIEICFTNAQIIFEAIIGKKTSILSFRENLIAQMLENYCSIRRKSRKKTQILKTTSTIQPSHMPFQANKRGKCNKCRNSIKLKCHTCQVFLCLRCYYDFHVVEDEDFN